MPRTPEQIRKWTETTQRHTRARDDRALAVLVEYTRQRGTPPSIRELARALGVAPPTGLNIVRRLAERGLIGFTAGRTQQRKIRLFTDNPNDDPIGLPDR